MLTNDCQVCTISSVSSSLVKGKVTGSGHTVWAWLDSSVSVQKIAQWHHQYQPTQRCRTSVNIHSDVINDVMSISYATHLHWYFTTVAFSAKLGIIPVNCCENGLIFYRFLSMWHRLGKFSSLQRSLLPKTQLLSLSLLIKWCSKMLTLLSMSNLQQ